MLVPIGPDFLFRGIPVLIPDMFDRRFARPQTASSLLFVRLCRERGPHVPTRDAPVVRIRFPSGACSYFSYCVQLSLWTLCAACRAKRGSEHILCRVRFRERFTSTSAALVLDHEVQTSGSRACAPHCSISCTDILNESWTHLEKYIYI